LHKGTILSVEDDANLQIVIGQYLESDGYKVIAAETAGSALEKANSSQIDVILLDLTLPDGEGLTLIPQFQSKNNAGIIVVSGKTDTTEKIVCLEMGADDYITKPFEMRELAARIKAVLRRRESGGKEDKAPVAHKAEKIKFGNGWCLDRTQYQLFDNTNQSVGLTTGEFKLLEALVTSAHRALSREFLFELTREGEFDVYDRAIDIQIARLRKKLGDDTQSPKIIKTLRGVGYMFVGEISP
jgi:two-component system phosphate regulon response regulator OmpR